MNLRDGLLSNRSYYYDDLPSHLDTVRTSDLESTIAEIERMQAYKSRFPITLTDRDHVLQPTTDPSNSAAGLKITTSMLWNLKAMVKKARQKIQNRKSERRIIRCRQKVKKKTKKRATNQLKMGNVINSKDKIERQKKIKVLERYIENFYHEGGAVVPLDILQEVSYSKSVLNVVRFNLNKVIVKNKFSTKPQNMSFRDTQKKYIVKSGYSDPIKPTKFPIPEGKFSLRESSERSNYAVNGDGLKGTKVRGKRSRRGAIFDDRTSIIGTQLKDFSNVLVAQAEEEVKEYDKIFENNFQTFYTFHFYHLSANSLNFLKKFVRHFILDRYYKQDYNKTIFELDGISEEMMTVESSEEEPPEDPSMVTVPEDGSKAGSTPDSPRKGSRRPQSYHSDEEELSGFIDDSDSSIHRRRRTCEEFSNENQINRDMVRFELLRNRKSKLEATSKHLKKFRKLKYFKFNSTNPKKVDAMLMSGKPCGRLLDPPLLSGSGLKYGYRGYKLKHFKVQGSYFYWANDITSKRCRGYVNLGNVRVGVNKSEISNDNHLILHPRHDGNPLEIKMDVMGEKIKDDLLNILSLIEVQKMVMAENMVKGYNRFFQFMEPGDHKFSNFRIEVKPLSPAIDAKFFRALSRTPFLRKLSLINIRFSTNGIVRLSQLMLDLDKVNPGNNLVHLELVNNGLETYNSTKLFKVICERNLARVKHLRLAKNKIGDRIAVQVINTISERMNRYPGRNLYLLDLSSCGLSDASILCLQSFFDAFKLSGHLVDLRVGGNNITENGLIYLGHLVSSKRVIEKLDVSNCEMLGDEFLGLFLRNLGANKCLRFLDYSGNKIVSRSVEQLMYFLFRNLLLTEARISPDFELLQHINFDRFSNGLRCFRINILEREKIFKPKSENYYSEGDIRDMYYYQQYE